MLISNILPRCSHRGKGTGSNWGGGGGGGRFHAEQQRPQDLSISPKLWIRFICSLTRRPIRASLHNMVLLQGENTHAQVHTHSAQTKWTPSLQRCRK